MKNIWWCSISEHKSFKRIHRLCRTIAKTIKTYTVAKISSSQGRNKSSKKRFLGLSPEYSKLVEVDTVADVDDEDRIGNSLLQIWKLKFGHKA